MAIAHAFATELVRRRWNRPVSMLPFGASLTLRAARAVAGRQPKASCVPPLVPEFQMFVPVSGPLTHVQALPTKLKSDMKVPASCRCPLQVLPAGARLRKRHVLRPSGGGGADHGEAEHGEAGGGGPHGVEVSQTNQWNAVGMSAQNEVEVSQTEQPNDVGMSAQSAIAGC